MKDPHPSVWRGFTLVEMLATTALTSLLMIAVLSVMTSIAREHRASAGRSERSTETDMVELIRWDLANATHIETGRHQLVLTGNGAIDPATLQPAMPLPTTVIYQIRQINGRSWLSRYQKVTDQTQTPSIAIVCSGVREIHATPAGTPAAITRPHSMRLKIAWDDPTRTDLDELLVLR